MDIAVDCQPADEGWRCSVTVGSDQGATSHAVTVTGHTARRLAPADADPSRLVAESFRFLLEREPRESILRSFELPLIGRYFPEWEQEISARLRTS
jgi:hypothetical protein